MLGGKREFSETVSTLPAVSTKVSGTRKKVKPPFELFNENWSAEEEASCIAREEADLRDARLFAQRVDDCTEGYSERAQAVLAADGGESVVDDDQNDVIERPSQLQEVLNEAMKEREAGFITIPDVGAKQAFGEKDDRPMLAMVQLEEQLQQYKAADAFNIAIWAQALVEEVRTNGNTGIASSKPSVPQVQGGEAEDQRHSRISTLLHAKSTLPDKDKNILFVEKHYGYVYPWWNSTSVMVRLWGQLSCDLQLVTDAVLLKDIVQILGKDVVKYDPEINRKGPFTFGKLVENVNEMKRLILEKYADNPVVLGVLAKAASRKSESLAPANENDC